MSRYYPHMLTIIRKDKVRKNDILKGALLIGFIGLFIIGLFAASHAGHSAYKNWGLACTVMDIENCPSLTLLS